jgi:hypothetical protein
MSEGSLDILTRKCQTDLGVVPSGLRKQVIQEQQEEELLGKVDDMGCQNNKGVKLLHTNTQRLISTVFSALGRGRRVVPFFCSQDEDAEHLVSPSRSRSLYRRKSCPTNA